MVPSTTRGVLSLLQVTEVAGPPVEVQTKVCEEFSYITEDTIGMPMSEELYNFTSIRLDVHTISTAVYPNIHILCHTFSIRYLAME